MAIVSDLFKVHIAKSHPFESYREGNAAFITNGFRNNGTQGYVNPQARDRIFDFIGICLSAFCEATIQTPPFLGRGNGGSGMIVLEPLAPLAYPQLLFYASYFNNSVRWRFSYGRMVTKERVVRLEIPEKSLDLPTLNQAKLLPKRAPMPTKEKGFTYKSIPLISMFDLKSGDYHNASELPDGEIPLISCGDNNNGVMKFVSVPTKNIYENTLTIAYNGQPLTAKYHPYRFAAKDDVAVCLPRKTLSTGILLFVQLMLNSEQWRFSFGRKCFREKLSQAYINMPVDARGRLNETAIERFLSTVSYWDFLKYYFSKGIQLNSDIVE
jgi:hypothetical protein